MTAIYKTGTVSVNNGSNIVTGNGTSFIDVANVQEGDLFTLDGQKFYEIYAVDTNTQIKIRNIVTGGAFAETNVTAGNFAIIRNFTSQTSAEIAGKVLAVQQKWMNREEEMTDWFYTSDNWANVTSINGDALTVMTPNGINNLLGPGAFGPDCRTFGIGGQGASFDSDDANNGTNSGIYRATSSTANIPISGTSTVIVTRSYNVVNQLFSNGSKYYFRRSVDTGSSWDDWREIYHSGNSANPLDYGAAVKNQKLEAGANLDTLFDNGTYTGFGQGSGSASTGDNPFTGNGAFTITVSRETFGSDNYTLQTATWYANNTGILQKQRVKSTEYSGWTDWYDVLNTSNTNFTKFGGIQADDYIGFGFARTSTLAVLRLPINFTSQVNSITVNGTFSLRNGGNVLMASGIGAGSITLAGNSSQRWAILLVTVPSGLTIDENLYLIQETAGSYIEVNK